MNTYLSLTMATCCGALSLLAQIPGNGLVSQWSFNANLTLDSHGTHTLTNSNAVLDTGYQALPNTAVNFNGSAMMSANNAAFRATTFSMATWFKTNAEEPYHTLANVRINPTSSPFNSYNLCLGSSTLNYLTFFFTTSSSNDIALHDTSFTDLNVWTHVALTVDYNSTNNNTAVKMYVNGVLHAQTTQNGSIIYGTNKPFTLGSVNGAPGGNSLDGNLDEFLFYNRVLAPFEVASIYNSIPTGIRSYINNQNSQISIYPNPTSSILNIEVKEQTHISIINIVGEIVKTETINSTSKLDVSKLNAGVYFIQDAKSGKAIKFIKE